MDEESWEVAIEEQDCQQAIAGASVGTSYVCQLPSSTSLNIDLEEHDAVSHRICVMLLYQTNNIDHSPKYSKLKLKNSTIWDQLSNEARWSVLNSLYSDMDLKAIKPMLDRWCIIYRYDCTREQLSI